MIATNLSLTPSVGSNEALTYLNNKCTHFVHLKQFHAKLIRTGLLSRDEFLVRKMITLSSSFGNLRYAALLFDQIEYPLTFTWNLMIRANTVNENSQQAIALYNLMICRGVLADKYTFPFVIKALCIDSGLDLEHRVNKGKEVHGFAVKCGLYGDVYVQNTLMDFYFKCRVFEYGSKVFDKMSEQRSIVSWTTMITGLIGCGELDLAREVFEQMPVRNVVSWSALIDGFVKSHRHDEAFELFKKMQIGNVSPNEFTLVSLLRSCIELSSIRLGKRIHDYAVKNGFKIGVFLGTALIDMYSNCGSVNDARRVFNSMETKSVATWNSMITSLGVHGCAEEALALFKEMENLGVRPDIVTFVGVLSACVNTNNLAEGLRYFKHMTEHYGIDPIKGHHSCIAELHKRATMLDECAEK